jgi:hypothetical protein
MPEALKQVGEFTVEPPMPVRSNMDKYDKTTIVSIYPLPIENEIKYTIQPGVFNIPAGTYDKPSVVIIGASSWWMKVENMPPVEIRCSSGEVAHSIVNDYCTGIAGCDMDSRIPGIFFIPGASVSPEEVKMKYASALLTAKNKQDNWYKELVRIADSLWSRYNGNPLVIWDQMKLAARMLNLETKPWLADHFAALKTQCFACGNLKDPEFPVCPHCKTIDPTHPRAADIKRAE